MLWQDWHAKDKKGIKEIIKAKNQKKLVSLAQLAVPQVWSLISCRAKRTVKLADDQNYGDDHHGTEIRNCRKNAQWKQTYSKQNTKIKSIVKYKT